MFSTVSIMPGMDIFAPDRAATSSGLRGSPNFLPVAFSTLAMLARTSSISPGELLAGVVVIAAGFGGDGEAGRTGSGTSVMSARLAPFAAEQVLHARRPRLCRCRRSRRV
jgi:hypothetical protein